MPRMDCPARSRIGEMVKDLNEYDSSDRSGCFAASFGLFFPAAHKIEAVVRGMKAFILR